MDFYFFNNNNNILKPNNTAPIHTFKIFFTEVKRYKYIHILYCIMYMRG